MLNLGVYWGDICWWCKMELMKCLGYNGTSTKWNDVWWVMFYLLPSYSPPFWERCRHFFERHRGLCTSKWMSSRNLPLTTCWLDVLLLFIISWTPLWNIPHKMWVYGILLLNSQLDSWNIFDFRLFYIVYAIFRWKELETKDGPTLNRRPKGDYHQLVLPVQTKKIRKSEPTK